MRALGVVRREHLNRQMQALAKPPRRDAYVAQTQLQSYNEVMQLESAPCFVYNGVGGPNGELQNADGTFIFLAGYDRL
jgi:hypothetical protein